MTLEQLEVAAYEPILPKWLGLLKWARSQRFIPGPGQTWEQGPNGVRVTAAAPPGYPHPFRVAAGPEGARVAPGRCDAGKVRIGKWFLDGERVEKPGVMEQEPILLWGDGVPSDGETWVAIRRGATAAEPAEVVHLLKPDPRAQPLAIVIWRKGQLWRAIQVVRHDLNSRVLAGGRAVLFYAV